MNHKLIAVHIENSSPCGGFLIPPRRTLPAPVIALIAGAGFFLGMLMMVRI